MKHNTTTSESNPFAILGLEQTASEEEVRHKYLELVKQHPPESDPERFREIHQAYESAKDPLILAKRLLAPSRTIPEWNDVIGRQKNQPPALSAKLLLALGNRPQDNGPLPSTDSFDERIDAAHE